MNLSSENEEDLEDPVCHCGAIELKHWQSEKDRISKRHDLITATINELRTPSVASSIIKRRRSSTRSTPVYYGITPPDEGSIEESNETLVINDLENQDIQEEVWHEEKDIEELETNAFGLIDFINEDEGSDKPARYVRLSDESPMDGIKHLLRDHWHFFTPQKPQLALLIIGGGSNFHLEGKYREVFKSGLTNAARSTNALIITTGQNEGAVKLVGDAVNEAQYFVPDGPSQLRRALKLLGIASWGLTKNTEDLINIKPNVLNRSQYYSGLKKRKGDVFPVNGDHTNFLFVDDGHRNKWSPRYNDFVSRFITMIKEKEPHVSHSKVSITQ